MTKAFKLNWRIPVPSELQEGSIADRWTDDGDFEPECTVKVDDCGFFIYWKSDAREGDVLELSQVNDIRSTTPSSGLQSALRQKHGDGYGEKSITVCSGLDMVNINLNNFVFADRETAETWKLGLRKFTNNVKINNVCPTTNLEKHWKRLRMTTTVEGKVSVRAIAKTFASGKTEKLVYQTLSELGLPNGKNDSMDLDEFSFDTFLQIYKIICPRSDIDELFQSITNEDAISVDQLITFLNDKQRDPRLNEILYPHYDERRAIEIISAYEKNQEMVEKRLISKEGLTNYLMSDENAPVFLDRLDIYQDMDQPLTHYYINSSHNTYLTGRQFRGKSSVEMYRQVLLAGCRCVELDCWDGKEPNFEPIITHGRAMCSEILFKDVIYAIRDCAFVTSEYPVILSFENHCSRQQQYKMALYCDEIFGDLLLKETLTDFPLVPGQPLPSPNRVKRKILIKNKRLKPEVEKIELEQFRKGELQIDESEEEKEDPTGGKIMDSLATTSGAFAGGTSASASPAMVAVGASNSLSNDSGNASNTTDAGSGTGSINSGQDAAVGTSAAAASDSTAGAAQVTPVPQIPQATIYQGSTLNVHPYLSSMVIYTQPMKFQGFDVAEEENLSFKMSSFPETSALGYLKTQAIELVNYNKRQLSRLYPKGARVESSNFMPQIFWNSGCQLVSLNFQTPDLPMQLNQGKFEYNGNCGYLLKPDFMRRDDKQFDPFAETPVDGVIAAQCSVQVISGQFLSDKKVGTYVEVDMYGLPTDTIRKEYRTKVVPANGLNPVYNEEPFRFRKVVLPELAVLRFAVFNDNNKMLGQRILPFQDLQSGYRHIALRTEGNFPMSLPMLFCNIELSIYIPDGLIDFMDALSDPRAYISAQEKRAEQLMKIGVEDGDINDKDIIMTKKKKAASVGIPGIPGVLAKKGEEKEETKFEPITAVSLRSEKPFVKISKKHHKELEATRKKHQKERGAVQKQQCVAIEKLVKTSKGRENDVLNDTAVKQEVVRQTNQWSEMMEKHRKEEWELMKAHLLAQEEVLKKLMSGRQVQQMKELEAMFERENREMKTNQARISVEVSKEVSNDKSLKSKAERENRLREKHSNNTKLFIDERKTAAMRQDKRREKLKKLHENQMSDLTKYVQNSVEMCKSEEVEYELAAKQECFV